MDPIGLEERRPPKQRRGFFEEGSVPLPAPNTQRHVSMSAQFRSWCTFLLLWFFLCYSFRFYLFFSFFPHLSRLSPPISTRDVDATGDGGHLGTAVGPAPPPCPVGISRFYVYDLPCKFNSALSIRCRTPDHAANMCPDVSNGGLGRPIPLLTSANRHDRRQGSWHATHHSAAEVIFHHRALRHPCRTLDPDKAELFYVPFYGSLDVSVQQGVANLDSRRRLTEELAEFLAAQRPWGRHGGRDHFLVLGRPAWYFMACDYYGFNRLLGLPEVQNMTVLTVERVPEWGINTRISLRYPTYFPTTNQFGIPYPSYFHPRSTEEVAGWQAVVRRARRTHLFVFVGGRMEWVDRVEEASVRAAIFPECEVSQRSCRLVECVGGGSAVCGDPEVVLEAMMGAEFCLQPPGEWFTRRSVFDAVLAGCVPVFFSELTAQLQYEWYLPAEAAKYSVFLGGDRRGAGIGEELARIPKAEVAAMREKVIELIPAVTYAHPDAEGTEFADAVDVALARVSDRVQNALPWADRDHRPLGIL